MIFTLHSIIKTDGVNQKSNGKNAESFYRMHLAGLNAQRMQDKTQAAANRLATRKKAILQSSMEKFVEVYEVIQTIDFEDGDGIKELANLKLPEVFQSQLKGFVELANLSLNENQKRAAFIVGQIKNGDLLFGGYAEIDKKVAQLNASVANKRKQESKVVEARAESQILELRYIANNCDKITDIITKLNVFFYRSVSSIGEIIDRNGTDRRKYSREDKETIMTCINLVSALKSLIDTPIFDDNGENLETPTEMLHIGNQLLTELGGN